MRCEPHRATGRPAFVLLLLALLPAPARGLYQPGLAAAARQPSLSTEEAADEALNATTVFATSLMQRLNDGVAAIMEAAVRPIDSILPAKEEVSVLNETGLDLEKMRTTHRVAWHRTANRNGTSWQLVDMGLRFPEGADIWNTSIQWVNVSLRHPAGVVSNVHGRKVLWADVHFLSVELLYIASLVAYPASLVFILLLATMLVSVCMAASNAQSGEEVEEGRSEGDGSPDGSGKAGGDAEPLELSAAKLSPAGRRIFASWALVCRTIPAWMVWGLPFFLIILSYPMPQEVFMVLVVYTSVFIFCNGVYIVFFTPFIMAEMQKTMSQRPGMDPLRHGESQEIVHWVVVPNYSEDIETLSGSIETVGQSSIARTQICLLLAMEERDNDAKTKELQLRAKFAGRFKEVATTYHPRDLPNDPPGKASNMAWAFRWLTKYVEAQGQDITKVIVTVADADSDLHKRYFEQLTLQYVEAPPLERQYLLFQAPVFHVKNYHRVPAVIMPGIIFTGMQELATLADPNAIRFPYSTYSLAMTLGKHVGGWDAEWIAEDWHMGLKCFLLTLGRARVQTIALPTVNYVPEDTTWLGTLYARWSQAKRHALGFSDVSYYFMVLPLLFCLLSKRPRGDFTLQDFWRVFFTGVSYVIRLINAHALLGSLTLYAIMAFLLKSVLRYAFQDMRHFGPLLDRSSTTCGVFFGAAMLTSCTTSFLFMMIYNSFLKDRLEPASPSWQKLYSYRVLHYVYTTVSSLVFGVVSTVSLGLLVQMTALKVLFATSFEYETAIKPTKDSRLA